MTTQSRSELNSASGQSIGQNSDTHRAWLWWLLALLAASQLYVVRELAAALVLFAIVFAAIALVLASLYMCAKVSGLALRRLAELRQPALDVAAVPSDDRRAA